jgi:DNA-binding transcriptional ArsR family regulator
MSLLAAIATPRRREILRLVWDQEASAGAIHQALPDVTFGAVSQHLGVLERAGLVGVRRDGRHRFYRARPEALGPLRAWLESMWNDALYRLKVQAELEQARRGPRPARKPRRPGHGPHRKGGSAA